MGSKILNKMKEMVSTRKGIARLAIYLSLVAGLNILIFLTYNEYKNSIVNQQLQQMLGISKSICRSIELYINDIKESMKVTIADKEFVKNVFYAEQGQNINSYNDRIKAYYEAYGETVESVHIFNADGKALMQYPIGKTDRNSIREADIKTALSKKETFIGNAYMDEGKKTFLLNVYEPIFDGENFKGLFCVSINLDVIYDKLIAPVKIGKKGYAMVKDQKGTIIMHIVKEQVGMDVIESRKQLYPTLDYAELENLIKRQLAGEEGTAIYHSYWWGDNDLIKAKKLNAYSPVKFGDSFWIVAITMSYDELQTPINKFSAIIFGIASLIAIIIYIFMSAMIKMKRNKDELIRETKYLKMINEASEKLRRKEAELYHANKLKMIGTLTGGIAHDINNLLTPIFGYSELMLMRMPENSEYYEEVEEIFKASQKGKELIEQILLFSRNDNGITKVEAIDINIVTKETLKLLRAVLPKNIVIKENFTVGSGNIIANFTQIHQVIFNLCTNAYQAMKNKPGTIEISLRKVQGVQGYEISKTLLKDRDYVELEIKDTGCGMDEETKTRIFDPFFTTKGIGDGTGLGLFVVQNIIDKYEGAITVESEVGLGSCFKVYFPLVTVEKSLEPNATIRNAAKVKKRILIVDDNEEIIKVLKKGLKQLGYEVISETCSVKALKLFQSDCNNIDLVITDYMMPEIKGGELAAVFKEIKADTRIILMTGYIDDNKEALESSKAFDGYISKPIEFTKLSEVIEKTLNL